MSRWWFENSGQPAKDDVWKRHVLTTDLKRAYDVALVDLNGDGRLDVAASAWNGNHIAWFANPGATAAGQEWKKEMIDPQLGEARTARIADFNGDGKPDVLSTGRTANLTAWYEQTGQPGNRGSGTRSTTSRRSRCMVSRSTSTATATPMC